jgi:hypothetical protein
MQLIFFEARPGLLNIITSALPFEGLVHNDMKMWGMCRRFFFPLQPPGQLSSPCDLLFSGYQGRFAQEVKNT